MVPTAQMWHNRRACGPGFRCSTRLQPTTSVPMQAPACHNARKRATPTRHAQHAFVHAGASFSGVPSLNACMHACMAGHQNVRIRRRQKADRSASQQPWPGLSLLESPPGPSDGRYLSWIYGRSIDLRWVLGLGRPCPRRSSMHGVQATMPSEAFHM